MDLYIYYRVSDSNAVSLQKILLKMQVELAEQWQVQTDIKRRPELQDQRQTWMEIYRNVPDGFLPALQAAVANAGISSLIEGERHVESFVELAACA
jgi:hypothetical protein